MISSRGAVVVASFFGVVLFELLVDDELEKQHEAQGGHGTLHQLEARGIGVVVDHERMTLPAYAAYWCPSLAWPACPHSCSVLLAAWMMASNEVDGVVLVLLLAGP